MNIESQNSVSIQIDADEVRNILLEHIKRVAGGVVAKDMEFQDIEYEFKDVTFTWKRSRIKENV
jgi:hypothetical protein